MSISLANDYSEGCHPDILNELARTSTQQHEVYGEDEYSDRARLLIRQQIGNPEAEIYFVSGGTQANALVVAALLRPHEAVIAATTGHVSVHEAGAIEATGHKVIAVNAPEGKLHPQNIQGVLDAHTTIPHMVKPRLVYISNATETGTIYNRDELTNLHNYCCENNLLLYMDGARLGPALYAPSNDLDWTDLARFTDIFYIGGTKNGAMFGEAIVINQPLLAVDFAFHVKQRGALLAKGWVLGLQFFILMQNNLFGQLASHANAMAHKLANGIEAQGYRFMAPPVTNQIFPILPNDVITRLAMDFTFYNWAGHDASHTVIRLVTSWATTPEMVDRFLAAL